MIALHWIRSCSKQWKPFVENRVSLIQFDTTGNLETQCSGKENPADRGTRGNSAHALPEDTFWWHRPEWLKDGAQTHETELQVRNENDDVMECVVHNTNNNSDCTVSPLLELNSYSGLNRVLRITSWIQRFVHNAQTKEKHYGQLSTEENQQAEQ